MRQIAKFIVVSLMLCMSVAAAHAADPREQVNRAIELIGKGEFSLARSYLAPALISPFINNSERSRAYYLRGFSFAAQNMPVSARKDYTRALEFNAANPAALVELGRLHAAGRGIERDESAAFSLFEQAADLGYAPGKFHMGYAYLMGAGVEKNLLRAREILAEAADAGHTFAMNSLAASYRSEHVASPEPELAKEWYEKAHEAGDATALLAIGFMYAQGEFGEEDAETAVTYFRRAAEQDVSAAHVSLGYAFLTGLGVDRDYAQAFSAYSRGADMGQQGAFIGLGHLYASGLGVEQNIETARQWYERGARLGHVEAQLRLVGIFIQDSTEEARRQAVYWARQAATSGHVKAMNDYAWMLATSKFDAMRNGTLAVDQAEKAVAEQPSAVYLDTLAAAYAEIGNFERAVDVQLQALEALAEEDASLRGELETRLQYYRRSEPWRE